MVPTIWNEDIVDYDMKEDMCPTCEGVGRIISFNSELKDLDSFIFKRKK